MDHSRADVDCIDHGTDAPEVEYDMRNAHPELTDEMKHYLVGSIRGSMELSGFTLGPYEDSMAMLEQVLLEPPIDIGGRERIDLDHR